MERGERFSDLRLREILSNLWRGGGGGKFADTLCGRYFHSKRRKEGGGHISREREYFFPWKPRKKKKVFRYGKGSTKGSGV